MICYKIHAAEESYEEEEGSGVKMIGLFKKMGVFDMVLGVKLWPDVAIAQYDIYRMMLGRAKELIIENNNPQIPEKQELKTFKPNIIELEPLHNEPQSNLSVKTLEKSNFSNFQLDTIKNKLKSIIRQINESDIKALSEYINHAFIGKILLVLLVLLQKQKPTLSLAKEFYSFQNIKNIIENMDPLTIPKIQIQRAKKMMSKISALKPGHFEKISKCSKLIFYYIQYVLALNTNNSQVLPTMQKSLLSSKGEYLKSKYVKNYLDGLFKAQPNHS